MGRAKFKIVVKDVYAADYNSNELQRHNLKKLLFYAATNPDKLSPIGAYLVAKLGRRVRKGHDGHIFTTFAILDELIHACAAHLALFAQHVLAACKMVLQQRPAVSEWAVATFRTYIERAQDVAHMDDSDYFVQQFNAMARTTQTEALAVAGLRGLAAFVEFTADPDAFMVRFVIPRAGPDARNVVATVVGGMQVPALEPSARLVLEHVALRANSLSIRAVLRALFGYFTDKQLWNGDVPLNCLRCMSESSAKREVVMALMGELDALGIKAMAIATRIASEDDWKGPVVATVQPLGEYVRRTSGVESHAAECALALTGGTMHAARHAAERLEAVAILVDIAAAADDAAARKRTLHCAALVARGLRPDSGGPLELNQGVLRIVLRLALRERSAVALEPAAWVLRACTGASAALAGCVLDVLRTLWTPELRSTDPALPAQLEACVLALRDHAPLVASMLVSIDDRPGARDALVAFLKAVAADTGSDALRQASDAPHQRELLVAALPGFEEWIADRYVAALDAPLVSVAVASASASRRGTVAPSGSTSVANSNNSRPATPVMVVAEEASSSGAQRSAPAPIDVDAVERQARDFSPAQFEASKAAALADVEALETVLLDVDVYLRSTAALNVADSSHGDIPIAFPWPSERVK